MKKKIFRFVSTVCILSSIGSSFASATCCSRYSFEPTYSSKENSCKEENRQESGATRQSSEEEGRKSEEERRLRKTVQWDNIKSGFASTVIGLASGTAALKFSRGKLLGELAGKLLPLDKVAKGLVSAKIGGLAKVSDMFSKDELEEDIRKQINSALLLPEACIVCGLGCLLGKLVYIYLGI